MLGTRSRRRRILRRPRCADRMSKLFEKIGGHCAVEEVLKARFACTTTRAFVCFGRIHSGSSAAAGSCIGLGGNGALKSNSVGGP